MTPEDIDDARFTSVRRGGYEITEVDRFLADARAALVARDGRMSQEDVRDARFTLVKRGGYDTQQVDTFLDDLMAALAHVTARPDAGAPTEPAPAPQPAPPTGSPVLAAGALPDDGHDADLVDLRDTGTEPAPAPALAGAAGVDAGPAGEDPDVEPAPAAEPPSAAPTTRSAGITSAQLRSIAPPSTDDDGYRTGEVDDLLARVADTLEQFERAVESGDLDELRGSQFLQGRDGAPQLITGDQVRTARFTVDADGGYAQAGVDAALKRLARALDHHWRS